MYIHNNELTKEANFLFTFSTCNDVKIKELHKGSNSSKTRLVIHKIVFNQ